MGIQVEFNPDLCLRKFGTSDRLKEECLPEKLNSGEIFEFLKEGMRNFYLLGEIALRETKGNTILSKPLASIQIIEATHFIKDNKIFTKGKYKIIEILDSNKINFDGLDRIK